MPGCAASCQRDSGRRPAGRKPYPKTHAKESGMTVITCTPQQRAAVHSSPDGAAAVQTQRRLAPSAAAGPDNAGGNYPKRVAAPFPAIVGSPATAPHGRPAREPNAQHGPTPTKNECTKQQLRARHTRRAGGYTGASAQRHMSARRRANAGARATAHAGASQRAAHPCPEQTRKR